MMDQCPWTMLKGNLKYIFMLLLKDLKLNMELLAVMLVLLNLLLRSLQKNCNHIQIQCEKTL